MQFSKKLHERGWGRSRVRDYYDIWRIFKDYSDEIQKEKLPFLVKKKCEAKGIVFNDIEEIFNQKLINNAEREWETWLGDVVNPTIPEKEKVFLDLRNFLYEVFKDQ